MSKLISKMSSTTMVILGTVLVLVLPLCLTGYFATNNPALLVISMLGIVTFPVGIVMLAVGVITFKKKRIVSKKPNKG